MDFHTAPQQIIAFSSKAGTKENHFEHDGSGRNHGPLIVGDAGLAKTLKIGVSTVRTWRAARVIPFIKVGHRTIAYNYSKVIAALDAFETQSVAQTVQRKSGAVAIKAPTGKRLQNN